MSNLEELRAALTRALVEERGGFTSVEVYKTLIQGSTERIIASFFDFLKINR